MNKELNIRQEKFLKALLEAGTIEQACRMAGINKTTGYKYLKDEAFLVEYRKLRREAMQQVTARLQKKSEEAVDVLAEIMNDKDNSPNARVQAAKNTLDVAYRSIELDDIAERIEKVEAFMNEE
ncbi:phage replication protein [Enterococcus casseliflavus]|uniref:Phage replication protein n=1 Tax=Enterococcus casseliflavus TaxID=37734 RepID=A0A415EK90_ENTCA|nr:phage replication protein [Enterococcus casseliflavus]